MNNFDRLAAVDSLGVLGHSLRDSLSTQPIKLIDHRAGLIPAMLRFTTERRSKRLTPSAPGLIGVAFGL